MNSNIRAAVTLSLFNFKQNAEFAMREFEITHALKSRVIIS